MGLNVNDQSKPEKERLEDAVRQLLAYWSGEFDVESEQGLYGRWLS